MTAPPAAATFPGLGGVIAGIGGFNDRIILLNLSDGTRTTLLSDGFEKSGIAWSPSGDQLVVTAGSDLVKINTDGTGQQTLVDGPCGGSGAAWSPDGTKIAYHTCTDISIINADGSNPTVVPNTSSFGLAEWSPDGEWLVGSHWADYDRDIWKIRPDGNDLTQLADLPGDQVDPTVSPDGTMIAFEDRDTETDNGDISIVGINGGPVTNLTQTNGKDFSPSWSPDGEEIMFGSTRTGGGLFTMAADGSGVTEVPHSDGIGEAVWQPAQVTVSVSRRVVNAGATIQLQVRLAWPGTENPSVILQRRTSPTEWANWRTVAVDSSGLASVSARVNEHTWFRAVWLGDSSHQGGMSIRSQVQAKVVVTGHLFRFYATQAGWHLYHVGKRIWYTSDIVPTHGGRQMCFEAQRLRNGTWRRLFYDCYTIGGNGVTTIYIFNVPLGDRVRVRAEFRG